MGYPSTWTLFSLLPCWPIAHTEYKHDNDQKLVEILEHNKNDFEDVASSIGAVLCESERVGEDVERQVDICL